MKRYSIFAPKNSLWGLTADDAGSYVYYRDHEAALAQANARIAQLEGDVAKYHTRATELELDAGRYRWLRTHSNVQGWWGASSLSSWKTPDEYDAVVNQLIAAESRAALANDKEEERERD